MRILGLLWLSMTNSTGLDKMAADNQNLTTLISVAKQMHSSPQPGSERACMVKMPDGSDRLALTQLVNSKHHGSIHNGAHFYRVSFRFGGDSGAPDGQYDLEKDTAWCIVDHKNSNIVFGPVEGIQIRNAGIGIGSYLIAQLVRLLQQAEIRGNYHVKSVQLPTDAQAAIAPKDAATNDARIESFLTRVGFYVSPAAGTKVVGVRRLQDLRPWWNQEKVRFLGFNQFVDLACQWQKEKQQADRAVEAAERIVVGAKQQLSETQNQSNLQLARITELEAELETQASESQSLLSAASSQHNIEANQLRSQLDNFANAQEQGGTNHSFSNEVNRQILTISLAQPLMRFLWIGLAASFLGFLAYLVLPILV